MVVCTKRPPPGAFPSFPSRPSHVAISSLYQLPSVPLPCRLSSPIYVPSLAGGHGLQPHSVSLWSAPVCERCAFCALATQRRSRASLPTFDSSPPPGGERHVEAPCACLVPQALLCLRLAPEASRYSRRMVGASVQRSGCSGVAGHRLWGRFAFEWSGVLKARAIASLLARDIFALVWQESC